jgi:glucosamine--fructose-6-phosphate aminotransferase (isomerizing)
MAQLGHLMAAEIAEQPEALARLLEEGLSPVRDLAKHVRDRAPKFVLLAGRGTSDHAALYAKYMVEVSLGLPAGLASPSTMTTFGARPELSNVLWIAVSQSGESPDLVESTATARSAGAFTAAVTNSPNSPLAQTAEVNLDILAGAERAVAATKSYTSQLLALYLLVDAWRGGDARTAADLPALAKEVLSTSDEVHAAASRFRFVERLVTTARGYAYATAREAALKLIETSYLSAHSFSGADILHGPLALVDQACPVIAVAPGGAGGRSLQPVLEQLQERGADICLVGSSRANALAGTTAHLPVPDIDEQVSPILQIMPLQQLAHAMAVARGYDPDAPRSLSKVTETL